MTVLPHADKVAITNVRVFDGRTLTEPQKVVIDGSTIGTDAEVEIDEIIDGEGGTLLPGLIDAHVHVHNDDNLHRLASFGVTTALDMACRPLPEVNALRNRPGLTDFRSAGIPVTVKGTIHSQLLPLPTESLVNGTQDAVGFVQRRVAEGSDYIKIIADVPGPSQDVMNAVVAAAHNAGKKVVAHASNYMPVQMALEAGVDCITHVPGDRPIDSEMAEEMIAKDIFAAPTLAMAEQTTSKPPLRALLSVLAKPALLMSIIRARRSLLGRPSYENAKQSVMTMHRKGVPVLAGSDCHDEGEVPMFKVPYGDSLHHELELLVGAGLSTAEAIRAATVLLAKYFGLTDSRVYRSREKGCPGVSEGGSGSRYTQLQCGAMDFSGACIISCNHLI